MSMLAEPRKKQKWSLNPRGKQWSEDSNKFGHKMLEKMGWTNGKGLGVKEQGITEHVRVKFKDDQAGIGYMKNDHDKEWTQHQEGFNDLLINLQKSQSLEQTEVMETKEIALSGISLEQKSKQSKARVHYHKFTRGKDVNKYSPKDLANIFGKRTLEEKEPEESMEEFNAMPIGFTDSTGGILTIKGGNIPDYFKNKTSSEVRKSVDEKESTKEENAEREEERYVGFGYKNIKSDECGSYSQSVQDSTNYAFENPCLELNSSPKFKPAKKRKSLTFANEGFDLNYADKSLTPKKIKTEIDSSETSDCFVNPALNLDSLADETRNGADFEVSRSECGIVNSALDLSEESVRKKSKKKRKRDVELSSNGFVNPALNLDCPVEESHNGIEFEVCRVEMGLDNDALDLSDEASGKKRVTFNDLVEYNTDVIKKKKGKTKLDKYEVDNNKLKRKKKRSASEEVPMVFVNEALDVEVVSEEIQDNELNERKFRKEKRRRNRRMLNLETILEAPEEREITQDVMCDSEVLTLQDSRENFEEICEKSPKKNKKKKKKGEDKTEENVDVEVNEDNLISEETNNLRKKKKKKEKRDEAEAEDTASGFDKENKNESTSMEKTKKRKRKSSETCEFFLDDVAEEKVEEVKIEEKPEEPSSVSKKAKKKRSKDPEGKLEFEKDLELKVDKNTENYSTPSKKQCLEQEAFLDISQSPSYRKIKKSKRVLKAMFTKSPVLYFKGSNIHEIKGYGMDLR